MKNLLFIILLVFVASIPRLSSGQVEKIDPPKEPFLNRVSIPGAWTVTFTRPAEDEVVDMEGVLKLMGAAAEPLKPGSPKVVVAKPMVRTLTVTRTTDFAKEAVKFSDETTQTSYIFNVARVTKHVSYQGLIRSRTDSDVSTYSPNFANADFTGFEWLSAKNFKGVQDLQGRKCYVFEDEQVVPTSALMPKKEDDPKVLTRAFIDMDTKLPVALQLGKESRVYAFGSPNPADLVLPAEIAAEIQSWRAQLLSAAKAAPPP